MFHISTNSSRVSVNKLQVPFVTTYPIYRNVTTCPAAGFRVIYFLVIETLSLSLYRNWLKKWIIFGWVVFMMQPLWFNTMTSAVSLGLWCILFYADFVFVVCTLHLFWRVEMISATRCHIVQLSSVWSRSSNGTAASETWNHLLKAAKMFFSTMRLAECPV